jgi:NAD(P)-dependent dehydrogenase (short-subunit alcohol dehydrogenase family)
MTGNLDKMSTAQDVVEGVDLTGKRALVTGASSGIGRETVRALASRGAHVVAAARDMAKAKDAIGSAATDGPGTVEFVALDLASLASVAACADGLVERGMAFDLVIANAGIMACPFGLTDDGFETQLATNHLGHFLLVNRIAALIRPGGRLVMLSSSAHRGSDVDLDDPNFTQQPYDPWKAYSRSKTANMLFAVEFDRRHAARGIRACGVHPGRVDTDLFRHIGEGGLDRLVNMVDKGLADRGLPLSFTKTPAQGAATSLWAGVVANADVIGGQFCSDCQVALVDDSAERLTDVTGVRSYALDADNARALWTKSEEWIGQSFPE